MITRLGIKNYRSIVDLSIDLGSKQLLLGQNGAGKTSLFDALAAIRDLVVEGKQCDERTPESAEAPASEVFPLKSIPRWLRRQQPGVYQQEFVVEVVEEFGELRYTLVVEQNEKLARSRVFSEELTTFDGSPLFSFREGKVRLFRDNHTEAATFTLDWTRSALATVPPGPDNPRLTAFKSCLRNTYCLQIDAPRIGARSEGERDIDRSLWSFASWYRRCVLEDVSVGYDYLATMRNVVDNLDSLELKELGQGVRLLQATFLHSESDQARSSHARRITLDFNELSDGQRVLCALYAISRFLIKHGVTLCIDEPDNFISIQEIQPWLFDAQDRVDDTGAQIIIASHHPELLNTWAIEHGIVLEREMGGPTRARPFQHDPSSVLPPAERIARGWENV